MEVIKKIKLLSDGTIIISSNRREYKRRTKKNIQDRGYFIFQNQEFFLDSDVYRYDFEIE